MGTAWVAGAEAEAFAAAGAGVVAGEEERGRRSYEDRGNGAGLRAPAANGDDGRAVCREFELGRGLAVINESGTVLVERDGIVRYARSGLNPFKALEPRALLSALDAPETA